MKDLQREILSQVASGAITPEEGAARLEALESPSEEAPAGVAAAPAPGGIRHVKVRSRFGNAEIIGDASIAGAVADGPHRARQEGDTLVIEQGPLTWGDTSFEFSRRTARVVVNGFDLANGLTVRMNPSLPLTARVQAGNLRVQGIHGPVVADVQAGSCNVAGFNGPVTLSVMAGNIDAAGRLEGGKSSIRCQMGEVNLALARGSSVRLHTRSTVGDVSIEGAGVRKEGSEVTIGSGAGTLDLEATMGSIKVSVE